MMRVAAIYDIHANLPALEAVLEEIHRSAVDLIIVGGDVLPGPLPEETLARLRSLEIPTRFIHGNGDRVVLAKLNGQESPEVPEGRRAVVRWVASRISPELQSWLSGWPDTLQMEIPGLGEVLFCHATPRNDTEVFTRFTPEDKVAPALAGVTAALVVCGHTHMQFDRQIGRTRVVNAGSVGQPHGAAGAYWLLLGPEVSFQHTRYDLNLAASRIRASGYPQAEDFAAHNILNPPTEKEALQAFSRVELK
jgi:putative phosphoesterase